MNPHHPEDSTDLEREGAWVEVAVHGDDERVRLQPFPDVEQDLALWWLSRAER